jgi:hypothetical protein
MVTALAWTLMQITNAQKKIAAGSQGRRADQRAQAGPRLHAVKGHHLLVAVQH